jgi:hypothetical protein
MNNLFKMLGLLAFVLIGLGSAQTPAEKFNSERNATIQKWSNSGTQFILAKVGMTFDEVSKLSVKAGQGILMPPEPTGLDDIVVSMTQKDTELLRYGGLTSVTGYALTNGTQLFHFQKSSLTLYDGNEWKRRMDDKKTQSDIEAKRLSDIRIAAAEKRTQDEQRSKQEAQQKIESLSAEARNDVVAQALNYVSGKGEDAKYDFYYPVERNNGSCIFKSDQTYRPDIDLNKGNPKAIEFFTQGNAYGNAYISRVEGLPEFRCVACNGARVQRAWALIYKECKGTRKAF